VPEDGSLLCIADAAIAELEAEVERLKAENAEQYATWHTTVEQRAEQAEASLAMRDEELAAAKSWVRDEIELREKAEAELAALKAQLRQAHQDYVNDGGNFDWKEWYQSISEAAREDGES